MSWLISNTSIKVIIGVIVVMTVVYYSEKPSTEHPCSQIEYYPKRSAVYQCEAGMNTVALRASPLTYTTLTSNVRASAWLTEDGVSVTRKQLEAGRLGASVTLGPGSFMAIANGNGLVYVLSDTAIILSVAWHY